MIFSDPGAKNSACLMEVILRHYKLIFKKEVTKMDEMNNVTMRTIDIWYQLMGWLAENET